jgi:hypothetical protein
MGAAGVNIVVVDKNILGKVNRVIPYRAGLPKSHQRRKHA